MGTGDVLPESVDTDGGGKYVVVGGRDKNTYIRA